MLMTRTRLASASVVAGASGLRNGPDHAVLVFGSEPNRAGQTDGLPVQPLGYRSTHRERLAMRRGQMERLPEGPALDPLPLESPDQVAGSHSERWLVHQHGIHPEGTRGPGRL